MNAPRSPLHLQEASIEKLQMARGLSELLSRTWSALDFVATCFEECKTSLSTNWLFLLFSSVGPFTQRGTSRSEREVEFWLQHLLLDILDLDIDFRRARSSLCSCNACSFFLGMLLLTLDQLVDTCRVWSERLSCEGSLPLVIQIFGFDFRRAGSVQTSELLGSPYARHSRPVRRS